MTSAVRSRGGRPAKISREKILAAAAELPLEDVSMSSVAQRLGVTHASLYKYFPSRAALVAAVMIDHGQRLSVPDPDLPFEEWVVAAGLECREQVRLQLGAGGLLGSSGIAVVFAPLMEAFIERFSALGFSSLATADAWSLFRGCCLGAASDLRRVQVLADDPAVLDIWEEVASTFDRTGTEATRRFMAEVGEHLDIDGSFRRQLGTLVRGWQRAQSG